MSKSHKRKPTSKVKGSGKFNPSRQRADRSFSGSKFAHTITAGGEDNRGATYELRHGSLHVVGKRLSRVKRERMERSG